MVYFIVDSLFLGHIKYSNLEAKKSLLDSLSVPIGLVRGVIGSLEVKLSASSIFSNEPLKIIVRVHLRFSFLGKRYLSDRGAN